jgi:hypothetical protein
MLPPPRAAASCAKAGETSIAVWFLELRAGSGGGAGGALPAGGRAP